MVEDESEDGYLYAKSDGEEGDIEGDNEREERDIDINETGIGELCPSDDSEFTYTPGCTVSVEGNHTFHIS